MKLFEPIKAIPQAAQYLHRLSNLLYTATNQVESGSLGTLGALNNIIIAFNNHMIQLFKERQTDIDKIILATQTKTYYNIEIGNRIVMEARNNTQIGKYNFIDNIQMMAMLMKRNSNVVEAAIELAPYYWNVEVLACRDRRSRFYFTRLDKVIFDYDCHMVTC